MHAIFSLLALLLLGGCASAARLASAPPPQPEVVASAAGPIPASEITREVIRLRAALLREVPHAVTGVAESDARWTDLAKLMLDASGYSIRHAQLIVVVDRNPAVQQLRIVLAAPGTPWQVVGGSKVSTGQANRRGYYITPVGVFPHTDGIMDYRALGTFNENHIRGLGLKGMRVWDFGWRTATKGWRTDQETGEIRLLMHATDPDYLEQRLGRPASQGCVRVPATMNRFLDAHGVLDADYERAAGNSAAFAALLLPDRQPTPLAGSLLVVVDSAQVIQ